MSETTIPTWTLGDRLAKAREFAGLRHPADMAARLGVSDKTIRNWESGTTRVSDATIIAYAVITGVDEWWLRGELPPDDGHTQAIHGSRWNRELSLAAA